MKTVAKYNTYKGISTALTFGTPIVTLLCCGDIFVERSEITISATGIFVILLVLLFAKDKLLEYFKAPSALILSTVVLVLILLIEHIIAPMKVVCIATMIASGIDECTFKRFYTSIASKLPLTAADYKHLGFLFTNTKKLMEASNVETTCN